MLSPFEIIKKGALGIINQGKQALIPKSNAQLGITDQSKLGITRNTIMGIPQTFRNIPNTASKIVNNGKDIFFSGRGFTDQQIAEAKPTPKERIVGTARSGAELLNIPNMLGNIVIKGIYGDESKGIGQEQLEKFSQPKTAGEAKAMRFWDIVGFAPIGYIKNIGPVARTLKNIDRAEDVAKELKNLKFSDELISEYAPKIAKDKSEERIAKTISEMYAESNPDYLVKQLKKESQDYQKNLVKNKQSSVAKGDAMRTSAIIRKIEGKPTAIEINEALKKLDSNYKGKVVTVDGKPAVVKGTSFGKTKVQFNDGSTKFVAPGFINTTKASVPDAVNYLRRNAVKEGAQTVFKKMPDRKARVVSKLDEKTQYEKMAIDQQIDSLNDAISNNPAKQLKKFMSRKEGEFLDFKNNMNAPTVAKRIAIEDRTNKITRIMEDAGYGRDMDDPDKIRELIADYDEKIARIKELKKQKSELKYVKPQPERVGVSEAESLQRMAEQSGFTMSPTGVKNIQRVNRSREEMVKAYKDALNLPDKTVNRIIGNRDFRQMTEPDFDSFMKELVGRGEAEKKLLVQKNILNETIRSKELKKVDNIRKVLKYPTIKNMSIGQMKEFDELLNTFKTGDEFLGVRQLETVKNTDLAGIKTYREAREAFAKETGINLNELGEVPIPGRWRYDVALARQHPLYDTIVTDIHKELLNYEANYFKIRNEVNDLIASARKSTKRSFAERLVPSDKKIFSWLEADDATKAKLADTMTPEEMKAAARIRELFAEARDYLVQSEVLKQFKSNYITNVRRGFLEAWKDDGLIKAFKEIFESNKLDEAKFAVTDPTTGQALALEKFFKYSVRRAGKVKPTQNVADAVLTYFNALEKKKAFDKVIPKLDIYAASLDSDGRLRSFVKEYLNTKKGNVAKGFVTPGSKADWVIRTGVAFTRLKDLGLSIPIGLASTIGEQVGNYVAIGARKLALGNKRLYSKQGQQIVKKYENFIGESLFTKFADQSKNIADKFGDAAYGFFSASSRQANKEALLGMLTKEEFVSGVVSPERLAEIQKVIGRWRVTDKANSIIGSMAEGKVFTQYKTWAVPILESVADDLLSAGKALKNRDPKFLKSPQFKELYRVAFTAFVGFMAYNYVSDLRNKKDKTLMEDLTVKAAREANTIFQGLSPELWLSIPRLATFVTEIGTIAKNVVTFEGTKALEKTQKTLTPSAVKQFVPKEKSDAEKLWQDINKLPTKEEKVAVLNSLKKEDPSMAKSIKQVIKDEKTGITDEEKDIREMGVENRERATYIVDKVLPQFETREEKITYLKSLQDKGVITDEVKTQIKGILSGSVDRAKPNRKKVEFMKDYIKALQIDPANAIRVIGKEKLGIVQGNLVELQRDFGEEYKNPDGSLNKEGGYYIKKRMAEKLGIPISDMPDYGREHIVPVSAGGSNSDSNMFLAPIKEHEAYTDWDKAAGRAVKGGTMTRKEVADIAIKLKVDKSITVEEALNMLK